MPVTQVLPVAKRGSVDFGFSSAPVHFDEAEPQHFLVEFPSTDWLDVGHEMSVAFEASYDGGVTWTPFSGVDHAQSGQLGKDGLAHPISLNISWDGRAMDVRGTITITPPNFAWGLTVTTV